MVTGCSCGVVSLQATHPAALLDRKKLQLTAAPAFLIAIKVKRLP